MSLISKNAKSNIYPESYYISSNDIILVDAWFSNTVRIDEELESIHHIAFYNKFANQPWINLPADSVDKPITVIKGSGMRSLLTDSVPTLTYVLVAPSISVYRWLWSKVSTYSVKYPEIERTIRKAMCRRASSLRTTDNHPLHHFFVYSLVNGLVE